MQMWRRLCNFNRKQHQHHHQHHAGDIHNLLNVTNAKPRACPVSLSVGIFTCHAVTREQHRWAVAIMNGCHAAATALSALLNRRVG